jgi:leucine efflux protein
MLAIVLGAASVLQSAPVLFSIVRLVGALYLTWIGLGLVQIAWQRYHGSKSNAEQSLTGRLMQLHPFTAALGLSLTNPKAIFFFISFFSQFVDPAFPNPALSFLYLAIILQIISMAYLSVLIWAGQRLVERFQRHPRWAACLWFAVGFLFIAFALRLAVGD